MDNSKVASELLKVAKLLLEEEFDCPLCKQAQWEKLPKGWTKDSLKKYWDSLVGDVKHKVTKCIKSMEKSGITDAGAFCASLADKMTPGWRSR